MDWKRVDQIINMLPSRLRPGARAILLDALRHSKVPSLTEMEILSGLPRHHCRTIQEKFKITHPTSRAAKAWKRKKHPTEWRQQPHSKAVVEMLKAFYACPHTLTPSVSTREQSGQTLDRIIRIDMRGDPDPVGRLKRLLEFICTDDRTGFNWQRVTRSIMGLRNRSHNGCYKWENAEANMQELSGFDGQETYMDPRIAKWMEQQNESKKT
jgi:hypothetical protein